MNNNRTAKYTNTKSVVDILLILQKLYKTISDVFSYLNNYHSLIRVSDVFIVLGPHK